MYKIKVFNNVSQNGLNLFNSGRYEVSQDVEDPHGIILRSYSLHDMEVPPSLLAVARAGAGVNNIPIDRYAQEGIVVFNTPGANANAVKELVLAAIFLSSRRIIEGVQWANSLKGSGDRVAPLIEKGKSNFTGPEAKGKKLGIIGLGAIGVMVANDAHALGMEVTGYDPYISVESAWRLSRGIHRAETIDEILANSDYISIHIPLMEGTKGMIDKDILSKMKRGVRLLNFSRAQLVKDDDLLEALKSGHIGKYVTDFPNDKLLGEENVIPIPHLGASTPESEENCAYMAANELKNFLEMGNIKNSVNYPECELHPCPDSAQRLTIPHKNIPNMVGQITACLAEKHINIANMINKSKGDYAYTIIDIESPTNGDVLNRLSAIDGVIRVRLI
ncbi:MAG: phosphoglycerate dehydrogenase [Clostridiales bacterium]|nr:phosphoglycerate dehydrogenase [Clostridiales bacterium]